MPNIHFPVLRRRLPRMQLRLGATTSPQNSHDNRIPEVGGGAVLREYDSRDIDRQCDTDQVERPRKQSAPRVMIRLEYFSRWLFLSVLMRWWRRRGDCALNSMPAGMAELCAGFDFGAALVAEHDYL